jgi:acetyl-CoA acetyltransferase
VAAASAGVPPHIMGLGPVPSTRKVLERSGWEVGDARRRWRSTRPSRRR